MEFFVFLIFAFVLMGIFKGGRRFRRRHRQIEGMIDDVFDEAKAQVRSRRRRNPDEPPPPPRVMPRRRFAPLRRRPQPQPQAMLDFQCDHCGAQQDGPMDLSPSGDLKCAFCGNWFNVRS